MRKYFNLNEIEKAQIPHEYGYKAILIEDRLNNIGFYKLEKTQELIEIESLKQKLFDTDYQAIKFAEGLITVEQYALIKEQRQAWRDEINELEAVLEVQNENH